MVLIPSIIALYFAYHWIIARPEIVINYFGGSVDKGPGLFGQPGSNWYHQLDLYFNFTVSIIPLTHHWFCGKAGFVKEEEEGGATAMDGGPAMYHRYGPKHQMQESGRGSRGVFNIKRPDRMERSLGPEPGSREWR